jgi:hypothetical protein
METSGDVTSRGPGVEHRKAVRLSLSPLTFVFPAYTMEPDKKWKYINILPSHTFPQVAKMPALPGRDFSFVF